MNHKGTQTITTDRLTLRRFTVEDAPAMYRNWASDDAVTRWLTWPTHPNPETTASLLEQWCGHYGEEDYYNWVIKFEGEPIGNISVVQYTQRSAWCALGYCMGSRWWNKGIMTEAVCAVRDFLFDEVGFHRIVIEHAIENPGSGRVASKAGFTLEGVQRGKFYSSREGRFLDLALYGCLAEDRER
ncbi:MAG: GNAT family N-acetyltransferase [Clostridia bacterium]|nr:GNAT family N-acetyltransferase [Clostridia bacterium]